MQITDTKLQSLLWAQTEKGGCRSLRLWSVKQGGWSGDAAFRATLALADPEAEHCFSKWRLYSYRNRSKHHSDEQIPILSQPGKLLNVYFDARSLPKGLLQHSFTSCRMALSHFGKIEMVLPVLLMRTSNYLDFNKNNWGENAPVLLPLCLRLLWGAEKWVL